jgi:alcohol dehydrogenase
MSAYHHKLPHGAGLIMISLAYYTLLAKSGSCDQKLIDMAKALGKANADKPTDFVVALQELQKACRVDNLKMSDYGIQKDEINKIAENAYTTMGGLFQVDPCTIAIEDTIKILEESYR